MSIAELRQTKAYAYDNLDRSPAVTKGIYSEERNKFMAKSYFPVKLALIILTALALMSCDEKSSYKAGDVYLYKSEKGTLRVAKVIDTRSDKLFVCIYTDTEIINADNYENCLDYRMAYLHKYMNEDEKKDDLHVSVRVEQRLPNLPTSFFDAIKFDEFSKMNPTYLKNMEISEVDKQIADDYWKRYPQIE